MTWAFANGFLRSSRLANTIIFKRSVHWLPSQKYLLGSNNELLYSILLNLYSLLSHGGAVLTRLLSQLEKTICLEDYYLILGWLGFLSWHIFIVNLKTQLAEGLQFSLRSLLCHMSPLFFFNKYFKKDIPSIDLKGQPINWLKGTINW